MDRSDQELVQAARQGDRQAFALLYDRYARLVRAVCQGQAADAHAAADLAQETFLRAYRRLESLQDQRRFPAWLVGIARHVCREWQKQRRRPGSAGDALPEFAMEEAAATTAGADLERAERFRQLRTALAELPERDRLALHAFYVQDLGVERMCHLLDVSRSGLYHVLATARRRLAAKLDRQEVLP